MKLSLFLAICLLIAPMAYSASGSGPSSGSLPSQPAKRLTPDEKAALSYQSGIEHRDKAAKYEQKAAGEDNEKKRAKLQKKIDKEYEKAIKDYEESIEYSPLYFEVYGSLGYALRKVGRFDESLAAYNESLAINPSYNLAIEYRGEAFLGLNRIEDAKQAYMTLFRSDRALADELLAAMTVWIETRRENAGEVSVADVEQFSAWVNERRDLSSYIRQSDDTTPARWEN